MGDKASMIVFREVEVEIGDFCLRIEGSFPEGKFISLLGPSGSGKTTLLRSIAGFVPLKKGRIMVGDVPLSIIPPHRRNLGMVFQNYSLFPHRTVLQNIIYGLVVHRWKKDQIRQRADELLAMIQMKGKERRYPHELSGGEQQRVAVARAMASRPHLLLMDEPLSALDAILRNELRGELRELQQKEGISTLYVTHDYREALSLSDVVVVMAEGGVQQTGSPQELYTTPATMLVAMLMGEGTRMAGRWKEKREGLHCYDTPLGEWYSSRYVPSPAMLFFRPGALIPSGKNRIPSEIFSREFHGHYWRLVVQEKGVQIVIYYPSDKLPGLLGVEPENVLVFPLPD